jgi:hypothetical protein
MVQQSRYGIQGASNYIGAQFGALHNMQRVPNAGRQYHGWKPKNGINGYNLFYQLNAIDRYVIQST